MRQLEQHTYEDEDLIRPIEQTGPGFYLTVIVLLGVIVFAFYTLSRQFVYGLGVTGLAQPVSWGFYIINFVFFIGSFYTIFKTIG